VSQVELGKKSRGRSAKKQKPAQGPPPRTRFFPQPGVRHTLRLLKNPPQVTIGKPASTDKLLTKRDLLDRIGISYVTIWKMMRAGTFPRSRAAGGKLVWLESEINEWIQALPKTALKGDDEGE
jgi:predicted DNA-binding transcriptional regulator AlpA